jgi:tripartite-type tricarboxylate transporter receptor subunit TctC
VNAVPEQGLEFQDLDCTLTWKSILNFIRSNQTHLTDGCPDTRSTPLFGFVAPAGTPAAVISKLSSEITKMLATPAVREKMAVQELDLAPDPSPDAFSRLMPADMAKWVPIVKASGAKVD